MQSIIKKQISHIKQKLVVVLFLGCLLLAVTPKDALHQLFANHTDSDYAFVHHTANAQIAQDTINCQFDSVFTVNTLFYFSASSITKPEVQTFTKKVLLEPVYVSLKNSAALLRGPPAMDDLNLS